MENKRKFQRLVLAPHGAPPIEQAFAVLELQDKVLRRMIQNLSYRGMGLLAEAGDQDLLSDASNLPITLEIDGALAKTAGSVTHVAGRAIGVSFIALNETSRRIISAYLDPRYLGSNTRELPKDRLLEAHMRIFVGPNNTRIYLAETRGSKGPVGRFELSFLNYYLCVDEQGKVSTGGWLKPVFEQQLQLTPFDTSLIHFDRLPKAETLQAALRLLRYVPLEDQLRLNLEMKLGGALDSRD